MALSRAGKVANFAFYSRILVLLMQIFFNLLMPDHDAKVFNPPVPYMQSRVDYLVEVFLEGFRRWDGVYFIHIAEHGYTYENTLAFFPLYPFLTYILANTFLYPLQHIMNYFSVLLVSGYIINVWCFVQAAKVLYTLSHKLLKDETLAFKTVQLFCINPASIFFSAYYSEALFSLLVFKGMNCFEETDILKSSIWFGLSGLTRSNGLVNLGYPLYFYGRELIFRLRFVNNAKLVDMKSTVIGFTSTIYLSSLPVITFIIMICAPFLLYQYYASIIFCNPSADHQALQTHIAKYGHEQGYKMPHTGTPSEWCDTFFPTSYSYVQATHWNQGFMKYYEFKQTPNFMLATPMILLCTAAIVSYVKQNLWYCATLGLYKKTDKEKADDDGDGKGPAKHSFHSPKLFVYIVHLAFLLLCAVFFMHIQVITRFICSSSPVIYWFVAYLTTPNEQLCPSVEVNQYDIFTKLDQTTIQTSKPTSTQTPVSEPKPVSRTNSEKSTCEDMIDWENQSWTNRAIFVYFHLYFFVGVGAFSNFLPWT